VSVPIWYSRGSVIDRPLTEERTIEPDFLAAPCGEHLDDARHLYAGEREGLVGAPPVFEPGVEVLQTGSAIVKLLSRLAFWSA
jgi:hypothetical protein